MKSRIVAAVLTVLAACAPAHAAPLPKNWQKGVNVVAFRFNDYSGARPYYWLRQLRNHDHAGNAMFATRWIQYWKDPLRTDDVNATDIQPAYGTASDCGHRPRTDYTACQTPGLVSERNLVLYAEKLG